MFYLVILKFKIFYLFLSLKFNFFFLVDFVFFCCKREREGVGKMVLIIELGIYISKLSCLLLGFFECKVFYSGRCFESCFYKYNNFD